MEPLVVGIRLGCINHALLTIESIQKENVPVLGWIANHREENYVYASENIKTIADYTNVPLLGEVFFIQNESSHRPLQLDLKFFPSKT